MTWERGETGWELGDPLTLERPQDNPRTEDNEDDDLDEDELEDDEDEDEDDLEDGDDDNAFEQLHDPEKDDER